MKKKTTVKKTQKKTLFKDPRARIDKVTVMKIRDIQKWTGEKTNGETVRNSVDSRWQHLKEETDETQNLVKRLAEATNNIKKVRYSRKKVGL